MQFFSESPAPWKRQQESVKSAIKISTSEITTAEVVDLPTPLAPPVGKGSSSPLIGDHELESGGMGGLGIKEVSDWVLNHMQDFSKFLDVSIE
ncbi:40S ribosomal protein S7, partial [Fagus crenata]